MQGLVTRGEGDRVAVQKKPYKTLNLVAMLRHIRISCDRIVPVPVMGCNAWSHNRIMCSQLPGTGIHTCYHTYTHAVTRVHAHPHT